MDVVIQHPGLRRVWGPVPPGQLLELLGPRDEPLPWALLRLALLSGMSEVRSEPGRFSMSLDVRHFLPEELAVRVWGGFLEIQGRHGERQDAHGCISREFRRRYQLPPDVDQTALTCSLAPDGTLTCSGPKVPSEAAGTVLGPAPAWQETPSPTP
ncbi:alpha-crystallin A chain [Sorex araneus]|uniref:alpha-crystallin A chain n=1 Tax=Sorex araneus TaxID=42254 RepID=UPI0024340531|nr:alpha-crystallin A chain [Sorex araneus]